MSSGIEDDIIAPMGVTSGKKAQPDGKTKEIPKELDLAVVRQLAIHVGFSWTL